MKRIKIGILTMSDGREYLHEEYEEMNLRYQRDIAAALEATGDFEVVQGQCAIHTNAEARAEGQRLRDANVEATIFNFAIWRRISPPARICCFPICIRRNAAWWACWRRPAPSTSWG